MGIGEIGVGVRWGGSRDSYLVSISYLVPQSLSGTPIPIWYPIPYLVPHPPIWYPIPDRGTPLFRTAWHETTLTSHLSGILHSLIFHFVELEYTEPVSLKFSCKNAKIYKKLSLLMRRVKQYHIRDQFYRILSQKCTNSHCRKSIHF